MKRTCRERRERVDLTKMTQLLRDFFLHGPRRFQQLQARMSLSGSCQGAFGRFCCKSFLALAIKISFGSTRDFRVKMWGDLIV